MTIEASQVHQELGKAILTDGFDIVMDLAKSKGAFIHDQKSGKDFLDLFTFFASYPIGYNHPKLATPEIIREFGEAAVIKPSNSDIYTPEMAEFVSTFHDKAMFENYNHAFFVSGGALAVENALKAAFDYKVQRNFAKGIKEEKGTKIIHFKNAFHGRSGYTLSLTNTLPDKIAYFPKFDWPRLDTPGLTFPVTDEVEKSVAQKESEILAQIDALAQKDSDDIAAICIEPIQGEGGDVQFRKEFFQGLRKACDDNDWLLIFDEVQTGFGLTGKFWCYQHYGVEPDIISFGKKSQVCGIIAHKNIDRLDKNVFHVSSRINSTWGGNLVDMIRCKHFLNIIYEDKLVENCHNMGELLVKGLEDICKEFLDHLFNPRGVGLFCAFTFRNPECRDLYIKEMYKRDTIILSCGSDSARFRPSMAITQAEIGMALDRTREAMKAVASSGVKARTA